MNKKAFVIGTGLLAPAVIISVVVIMAVFIVGSALLSISNTEKFQPSQTIPAENNLLLQPITLEINSQQKEFLVFDAISLFLDKKIDKEQLQNALQKTASEKNKCFFLSFESYYYDSTSAGTGSAPITDREVFKSENILPIEVELQKINLQINNREEYFETYFGPCP